VRGSRALTQDGMSLLGHIFDLHARHGAIMALEAPVRKHAVSACAVAFMSLPDMSACCAAALPSACSRQRSGPKLRRCVREGRAGIGAPADGATWPCWHTR